jgi:hypothetical protein
MKINITRSLLVVLMALFVLISLSTYLVTSDVVVANVTITSAAPTVSDVVLTDGDLGTIQLTAALDTNIIMCNGTVTDTNGYQDVATNGGANATLYFSENGTTPAMLMIKIITTPTLAVPSMRAQAQK